MKITEVRTIVTCPGRNDVLVKILTDEPGLYGVRAVDIGAFSPGQTVAAGGSP